MEVTQVVLSGAVAIRGRKVLCLLLTTFTHLRVVVLLCVGIDIVILVGSRSATTVLTHLDEGDV